MFGPKWRIWVDWNGNGVWGEAGEDVAPWTTGLHWEWGRSADSERCPPARLDLALRNDDHRFSPPNAGSPLSGGLSQGRSRPAPSDKLPQSGAKAAPLQSRVWAQMAWPWDGFAGSIGESLAGRTLPVGGGLSWKKQNLGANGFRLAGGHVEAVAGTGADAVHTVDFGDGDAFVGLNFTRQSDGHAGLVLRAHNPFNYLRIRFGATATVLERVLYGVAINIRSGDALAAGVEHFVEVEMHGPSIRLFATGLETGSVVRQEILDGGGVAPNATATRHGLWHDGSPAAGSVGDRWADFGGWRSFFYGAVESITPQPDRTRQSCRLTALDGLHTLGETVLFTLLTGRNLASGAIANQVLTRAGFSPNDRELDRGRTLVASGPRALWRLTARRALDRLQDEEDGLIYMDGRGRLRLEEFGHRDQDSHLSPRAAFGTRAGDGPYLSDLAWSDGGSAVENRTTFRFRSLEDQGAQEVWRLRDVPAIPPGESRDFLAESSSYDAVDAIRVPAPTADYTANSEADGSGADLTGDLTVTLPSEADFRGRGTVVRVSNGSASTTAYVTLLKLRAGSAYRESEATIYEASDADSRRRHGERSREVGCLFIDNYASAREAAESRLSRRKNPGPWLSLAIPNGSGANLSQVVHRVLSDRIRVVYGDMGIDRQFFIEGMVLDAVAATGEVTARWQVSGA